ncbi:MAG: copper amine oxidase N-terminal domain-containing protein [Clostridiales bacterium]|nr:copper amine oxidase N-terminal domain-containing protein [Clostridiales bacterium]
MKRKLILTTLFAALMSAGVYAAEAKHMELDYSEIENSGVIVYKDMNYMPVRTVAEAMGLSVEWQGETKTVIISNGGPLYITFSIGTNGYTFAKTAPVAYEGEPVLEGGVTYIPVDTFESLMGYDIVETETAYNIITIYNEEEQPGASAETAVGEGFIASVSENEIVINDSERGEVVLIISEETAITDGDGNPLGSEALTEGTKITVEYGEEMTLSLPPENNPVSIVVTE